VANTLVAGLAVLMVSASPLLHADERDQRGGYDDNRPGQHQDQGPQGNGYGNDHNNRNAPPPQQGHVENRGGNRPPQDFGPVRQSFQQHRDIIGRGHPLPPNVHYVVGRPLPHGYGARLDSRSLQYLPHYDGYEWRRMGTDAVLIAVGTGIVYTILDGVLN